jgi:hypothetical protein
LQLDFKKQAAILKLADVFNYTLVNAIMQGDNMSEELFDVVFFGILQSGKERDVVMQNMAQLFKTDTAKLEPYFAGGRKVIKGKVNAETAEKYQAVLENAGLVIKIEPCENTRSARAGSDEKDTEPGEKSAQQPTQPEQHTTEKDTGSLTIAEVGADVIENPVEVPAQQIDDISNITMAEVGADVIENPVVQATQEIADFSELTMAEAGSDILTHPTVITPQKIRDISGISLAEVDTELTKKSEHH